MKADVVLEDCRRALDLLEDARNEQEFRVHWVALVALLRAVGHVLNKVDASSGSDLSQAVADRWSEWQRNREKHQIFWEFIEAERNLVLKTYEMGFRPGDVPVVIAQSGSAEVFVLDECVFKPLCDGPFAGEDCREVARDAISWWEGQLSEITRIRA